MAVVVGEASVVVEVVVVADVVAPFVVGLVVLVELVLAFAFASSMLPPPCSITVEGETANCVEYSQHHLAVGDNVNVGTDANSDSSSSSSSGVTDDKGDDDSATAAAPTVVVLVVDSTDGTTVAGVVSVAVAAGVISVVDVGIFKKDSTCCDDLAISCKTPCNETRC
jgi:hypothetical protein